MALVLESKQQILSRMISRFLAETGINDINAGSFLLTFLEAAAREDFQQYVHMLNIIRNFNLDTTTGQDLDDKAFEFGLERREAVAATGNISILRPSGFNKISSTFYTGLASPITGDISIFVNDASNFPSSGTVIIGRGTSNEEQVAYSSAPINNTNYWTINLDSPLSNDHGLEETVILAQGGNQLIAAGTVVTVPAVGGSPAINFTTDQDVTLLDGEERVDGVGVTAQQAGTIGNIPIQAIEGEEAFGSPPFSGARAVNESKFTTGRDRETDDELRDRIKDHIQSLSKGVKTAILNAIIGLVDPDTAKRVISANLILPTDTEDNVIVFIDDGTGFEPSFERQGFETVLQEATGGETRLQLDLFPLVKAQAETNLEEPYNMSSGPLTLTYSVGISSETITFNPGDFSFSDSATAEEITKVINNKATLIEARTSQVGSKVVISSVADENEDIQVTGGTANPILNFPTDRKFTLFLYQNDKLLSKDGITAFVDSGNQQTYDFSSLGAAPWPLDVIVDGKSANPQTVDFVSADFVNDSAATAEEVVTAINKRLAGAEASLIENDTSVRISSNTKNSADSKIEITGGTANSILGFPTSEVQGRDKDYTLNRFLGTIELNSPAEADDNFTAASQFTRAALRAQSSGTYTITSGETLVISIDGGSNQTITFPSSGTFNASQVATEINSQLVGGTALVREVGGLNFLEISTNTYEESQGSIRIDSSSTASALQFNFDTTITNQRPHQAFVVSSSSGPYTFTRNESLVVVLDESPSTRTYSIPMDFEGSVSSSTSDTVFTDSNFNTVFTEDDILAGFDLVFKSGGNTTNGTVDAVSDQGGGTFRYEFFSLPSNLADFTAGDELNISGLANNANNGDFIITAVNTSGNGYVEVTNSSGVVETGSSGSALIQQRRTITSYSSSNGQITVGNSFRVTPSNGDNFSVIPNTTANVVDFFNNTKVTTLSTKASVQAVEQGTKIQLTSLESGSDGAIQVTGGSANTEFSFSTTLLKGLQGYNHYVGLLKLVHKTIYGDDRDLQSFPGVGAAGINFDVKSPTVQEVSFNLDVTLSEGVSLSSVEDEIRSAITGYINSLGVGEDVIIEQVRARVIRIANITDVSLISPTSNQIIDDGEIARTRDSLITIG